MDGSVKAASANHQLGMGGAGGRGERLESKPSSPEEACMQHPPAVGTCNLGGNIPALG